MGVVYKAEDTKLERPVALKFLAEHAIEDPEHKARFVREAKAAARLDHQNICPIYEIDEVDGQMFLAMAYLEGQTLKAKIAERPLKLDEALDIAIQTAQGLKAAHQKKIVHRDIKPANLMLTEDGPVKIMDFGLAQLADRSRLTKTTTMLGTPAYMSPEQSQRLPTDRRTDVWSLGVVIYEMVTGRLPFEGERQEAVLYAIGAEDPEPITALRVGVPTELDRIVGKAMSKNAAERYQHVEEMIVDLNSLRKKLAAGKSTILQAGVAATHAVPAAGLPAPEDQRLAKYRVIEDLDSVGDSVVYRAEDTQLRRSVTISVLPESAARQAERRQRLQHRALIATAPLFVAALAVIFAMWLRGPAPAEPAPLRRFAFTPPEAVGTTFNRTNVAISPNGKHIAFVAGAEQRKLWVQDLDQQQPRAIDGTEGADDPFWSPDSNFIGFAAAGELKKVSVQGGLAIRVCELPGAGFGGGTWSPDGEVIVFSSGPPRVLYEVPGRGGTPNLLISPEESEGSPGGPTGAIVWPHFLPSEAGARVLVFAFGTPTEQTMHMVQNLDTGQKELLGPGAFPFYSPSGHLVYQSDRLTHDLWALPFSLDTLKAAGEAFPISENSRGPTVAADGTLVYLDSYDSGQMQLVWRGRRGERIGEIGQPQPTISEPALSPDGRFVAVSASEGSLPADIWIQDISRSVKSRLSFAPEDESRPVWSPDGKEVAYSHRHSGQSDILVKPADGSGEAQPLVSTEAFEDLCDWSADGTRILYVVIDQKTGRDLWYLERKPDGSGYESHPFLQTPFNEDGARFSPDGRFVAYCSNESGRVSVYVRPFPEGGARWQVSSSEGRQPRWRRDGQEIFYVEGDTLIAVSVSTRPGFSVGKAARLFQNPTLPWTGNGFAIRYDVSPDGQRFVLCEPVAVAEEKPPSIHIIQSWFAEFRGREQD